MGGRSISVTPNGGGPTLRSPVLLHSSLASGLIQRRVTVCAPTSMDVPFRCTTRCARGCTAGRAPTCSASKTPRMLSLPSCERLAASANNAKETCMARTIDGRPAAVYVSQMSAPVLEAPPPRARASPDRHSVRLTELSLAVMALIWGVNYSVVKYGSGLVAPLAYNGVRVVLAAGVLS